MKNILVTGCTGLVGHGICYYFLKKGYRVIGTTRQQIISTHPHFKVIMIDLREPLAIERLNEVISGTDLLIHNAAVVPKGDDNLTIEENIDLFNVNILATYRLLCIFEKQTGSTGKFIFISGANPARLIQKSMKENMPFANMNEYHTSKLCGELLCQQMENAGRINPVVLRINAPYGYILKGDAVIARFIKQAINSENIPLWGTGLRRQVFTFVEDIGYACELVLKKENAKRIFNITGRDVVTMKKLAKSVLSAFPESKSKIVYSNKPDPEENKKVSYPISKAKQVLGYSPQYDLTKGLEKIAAGIHKKLSVQIFKKNN